MEDINNKPADMTDDMLNLFIAYAKDNGNWSGNPLVGGNVNQGLKENGLLTNLKKTGYLSTFEDDGEWIQFTDKGITLMKSIGIDYEGSRK